MAGTILVVDDEESMRRFFELTLKREGYKVLTADSVQSGLITIREHDFDLILSDIKLGDGTGLEILEACKAKDQSIPVIMMTAYASPETAVEAMKLGALDYLTKPFNVDEVRIVVRNNIRTRHLMEENRALKNQLQQAQKTKLVFQSQKMKDLLEILARVAKMDTTILVSGESGTGKELILRTIHEQSPRSQGPFISVNCGALPESLFESELFGYEKGAFTGADQRRIGLLESARGGTLFLDEIGEMPAKMQVKLLRALQERSIRRVGGTEEIPVDFRLLAATNRDLAEEVEAGRFREDLFYRINVVPIRLPPLRDRREDILLLIDYFMKKYTQQFGEAPKKLTPEAVQAMENYHWPGNVRELENAVERIVALTPGETVSVEHLPRHFTDKNAPTSSPDIHLTPEGIDLETYLDRLRFQFIQRSMEMSGGVQSKSCKLLGMSFRSFRYYLAKGKKHGMIGVLF